MRRLGGYILIVALGVTLLAGQVLAQDDEMDSSGVLTGPPKGSLAAQLRLRLRLEMAGGPSLAASMDHNRQEWELLTPEQREQFRQYAVAFLKKNAAEQEQLIQSYSAFLSLNAQKREAFRRRAQWVKAVVGTFSPAQRQELTRMPSLDRAKALIARRDELVRQGKLVLDEPTTAPVGPTSRTAPIED